MRRPADDRRGAQRIHAEARIARGRILRRQLHLRGRSGSAKLDGGASGGRCSSSASASLSAVARCALAASSRPSLRQQFAQRDVRAPMVVERQAGLEVRLRLAPQRLPLAQLAQRVEQRRILAVLQQPVLRRLQLPRRFGRPALRIERREFRVPRALEAAHDDLAPPRGRRPARESSSRRRARPADSPCPLRAAGSNRRAGRRHPDATSPAPPRARRRARDRPARRRRPCA